VKSVDVIKQIDGQPIQDPEDVAAAIGDDKPGDRVVLEVERDGRTLTLHATLGKRPARIP
jgi:S1-C subfamily serine protease